MYVLRSPYHANFEKALTALLTRCEELYNGRHMLLTDNPYRLFYIRLLSRGCVYASIYRAIRSKNERTPLLYTYTVCVGGRKTNAARGLH